MRAVALHRDVLVASSALMQLNCVIVRGEGEGEGEAGRGAGEGRGPGEGFAAGEAVRGEGGAGETFVIDSPVLPQELDALPALIAQARFPPASALLATHGDWDHLLGRLAFPDVALGCAPRTVGRLHAAPGEAQRELRAFDEELLIERERPLALGSIQALPVPGRCAVGTRELELHETGGHTPDGMAILAPWAGVLAAGDYLSAVELPTLTHGGGVGEYLATLGRLRPLIARSEHVVPGHGPVLGAAGALELLEQDEAYLTALERLGAGAELPPARRGGAQRRRHAENVAALSSPRRS